MTKRDWEQHVFGYIFKLSNQIQVEGDKMFGDLTLKQWFLLYILYKENVKKPSVNVLASVMGVTRQSIKKMVSLLEAKEYVEVEKSPVDSRALCIHPTPRAYEFFQKNKPMGAKFMDAVFLGIPEDDLIATSRVMSTMLQNLSTNSREEGYYGMQRAKKARSH